MLLVLPLTVAADDRGKGHGRLDAQLTQFDGGCPPNECQDVQFSIHRAPVCSNGPNESLGIYSMSMVRKFSGMLSGGSSTLVRADDGMAFDLTVTALRPDAPYTIWWVAFNPDNECIVDGDDCTCSAVGIQPGAEIHFVVRGHGAALYGGGAHSSDDE